MAKRTPGQEIRDIERELRYIFKQDVIRAIDVNRANCILHRWKELNHWIEDPTPIFKFSILEWNTNQSLKN